MALDEEIKIKHNGNELVFFSKKDSRYTAVVMVNVGKFDRDFFKNEEQYIFPFDSEHLSQYSKALKDILGRKKIEMPRVFFRERVEEIDFEDGRHHYACLRDMGVKRIPVLVREYEKEHQKDLFEKRYS